MVQLKKAFPQVIVHFCHSHSGGAFNWEQGAITDGEQNLQAFNLPLQSKLEKKKKKVCCVLPLPCFLLFHHMSADMQLLVLWKMKATQKSVCSGTSDGQHSSPWYHSSWNLLACRGYFCPDARRSEKATHAASTCWTSTSLAKEPPNCE